MLRKSSLLSNRLGPIFPLTCIALLHLELLHVPSLSFTFVGFTLSDPCQYCHAFPKLILVLFQTLSVLSFESERAPALGIKYMVSLFSFLFSSLLFFARNTPLNNTTAYRNHKSYIKQQETQLNTKMSDNKNSGSNSKTDMIKDDSSRVQSTQVGLNIDGKPLLFGVIF